jgi:hypothetical protein
MSKTITKTLTRTTKRGGKVVKRYRKVTKLTTRRIKVRKASPLVESLALDAALVAAHTAHGVARPVANHMPFDAIEPSGSAISRTAAIRKS